MGKLRPKSLTMKNRQAWLQRGACQELIALGCVRISSVTKGEASYTQQFSRGANGERLLRRHEVKETVEVPTVTLTWDIDDAPTILDELVDGLCVDDIIWIGDSKVCPVEENDFYSASRFRKLVAFHADEVASEGDEYDRLDDDVDDFSLTRAAKLALCEDKTLYKTDATSQPNGLAVGLAWAHFCAEHCKCGKKGGKCEKGLYGVAAGTIPSYTTDGGNTLTPVAAAPSADPAAVQTAGLCIGDRFITFNAGTTLTISCSDMLGAVGTWTEITPPGAAPGEFVTGQQAVTIEKGVLYAATNFGNVYASTDYGRTWALVNASANDLSVNSIAVCDCTIILGGVDAAGTGQVLVSPTDGKGFYALEPTGATNILSVACCDEEVYALADDGNVWTYANVNYGTVPTAWDVVSTRPGNTQKATQDIVTPVQLWVDKHDCCCRKILGANADGDYYMLETINGVDWRVVENVPTTVTLTHMHVCSCSCAIVIGDVIGGTAYAGRVCSAVKSCAC